MKATVFEAVIEGSTPSSPTTKMLTAKHKDFTVNKIAYQHLDFSVKI